MNCPEHGGEMKKCPGIDGRSNVLRCPRVGCGWQFKAPGAVSEGVNIKLAGLERGKQTNALQWDEKSTTRAINEGAGWLKWDNLSTVSIPRFSPILCPKCFAPSLAACPKCRNSFGSCRPRGSAASTTTTPGLPDRFVAPAWMPDYLWIAMDDKGSHTPFSNETQEQFAARRRVAYVRTWDQALDVVTFVQNLLRPVIG